MSACPLDPILQKQNIFVDSFSSKNGFHFLTHAHQDHMTGLNKSFPSKIYCSEITRDLVRMQINIPMKQFVILKENQPMSINEHTKVTAIDSHHCDGSIMIVFEITGSNSSITRILYTGDFRFHNDMKHNPVLFEMDKMYFDDTLILLDVQNYPCEKDSFEDIVLAIVTIREETGFGTPIYINTQILGVEKVLRRVSDYLKEGFQISDHLKPIFRGKQLEYLMNGRICEKSNLILASRALDDLTQGFWIFPTSMHFLCTSKNPDFKHIPKNHFYIWFSCHANKSEISRLAQLSEAKELIPCKFAISHLKCHDKK
jgi:hypothetical protein